MERKYDTLFAALLVAVQYALAGGLQILLGNPAEFQYGPGAVLPWLIGVAVLTTAVLTAPAKVLPQTLRSRYASVLFAVGILGWVQSSFLSGGYGQFTGEAIDWSRFRLRGWFDLALWLVVITAACRWHRAVRPRIRFVAPLLTVLILLPLVVRGVAGAGEKESSTNPASLAQFSRTRNVLHVLMDGFQTGTFLELVEDEDLADDLEGFTVFPENSAVAAYTAMNLPAIFSGEVYDGTETPAAYHHRALRKNGFHHRLHDEGFVVNLIPKVPMEGSGYTNYAETPHTWGVSRGEGVRRQALLVLDMGLFRSSPHFLRRWLYAGGNWRLGRAAGGPPLGLNTHQRAFFAEFIRRFEVHGDAPVYTFIHLLPPHDPCVTLPDGTDAGEILPTNHENYRTEAWFTLKLFLELLDRMKEAGIYDDALIVLQADHGLGSFGQRAGDDRRLEIPRAAALLAVKRPGATGPLKESRAPTCVADIPATILGELGLENHYPGIDVFDLAEDEPRLRIFNSYSLGAKSRGVITRHRLDGSLYDPASWSDLGDKPVNLGRPTYTWGTEVEFGVGHDSDRFLGREWSSGGAGGCRINLGDRAGLALQVEPTPEAVHARFTFRPRQRESENRNLAVRLRVRGREVGEVPLEGSEPQECAFVLPAGSAARGRLGLEFEFVDLDGGRRGAVQAFCLVSMELEPGAAAAVDPADQPTKGKR